MRLISKYLADILTAARDTWTTGDRHYTKHQTQHTALRAVSYRIVSYNVLFKVPTLLLHSQSL
jgi:hypothetical protein